MQITKEKLEENNLKIMKFLGYDYYKTFFIPKKELGPSSMRKHEDLHFHDEYREIMLVLEEIEKLGFETIISFIPAFRKQKDGSYFITDKHSLVIPMVNADGMIAFSYADNKFEAIYTSIIQFIDWFNAQYKNTTWKKDII